jgi:hypothetical protein
MALWRWVVIGCGAVFGIIVPAWNAFKWLIGWGEHIEFIAHRVHDIHYVGPMLEALLNPPPWLPLASVPVGFFLIWLALRTPKPKIADGLGYLQNEDSELGGAIRDMAWRSAWGKWFTSQSLANNPLNPPNESLTMHAATHIVLDALTDGSLEVRGRRPGQMDYEQIPQTHWRSTALHMIPDSRSLWKMILIPRGGAEITPDGKVIGRDQEAVQRTDRLATYDSLIVNSRQFEKLWPRKDGATDLARKRLLKKAKKAGAATAEIAKLSQD